jgi:hypothetical protein
VTIYPDTNIWNELCDLDIDPAQFGATLVAKGARLVLSYHTVYEFLKNFRGSGAQAPLRAAKLFSYLSAHLVGDHIICVHEVLEFLALEMAAVVGRIPAPDPFVSKAGLTKIIPEVRRLAGGEFGAEADAFVNERFHLSSAARSGQKDHTAIRDDMKKRLADISANELGAWLVDTTSQRR